MTQTTRDQLIEALRDVVEAGGEYETEYDGQMLPMCTSCNYGMNRDHDADCAFVKARAVLKKVNP